MGFAHKVGSMRTASLLLATLTLVSALAFAGVVPVLAWTPGQSLDHDFPRISNWCPDVDRQPLSSIARYDYIALYDGDRWAVPALRKLKSDLILLNFTSAVEVHLNHELFLHLPNAWFLTQAGSKLTSAVTTGTTTFSVADAAVFRSGQLAVIDEELVQIQSVATGRITVKRGMVPERTPASSHQTGARIAAVVSNRPGEIEMDISTYCPKVTVDPLIGPETWGQYAARLQAQRCASADWDGVIADRVEGGESYFVSSGLAQSIDPTRSNTKVTDGYAAFDREWDAGIRGYEETVRQLVGPKRLVVANNGTSNPDLINGSNIEGFPKFDPRSVGSLLQTGSYAPYWRTGRTYYDDWSRLGLQPNLSTIMTYDDESTPILGRAVEPTQPPDYRKMRFGLGTALMSDGFFSYQLAVWGPRVGLFWFDEYDNAGKGRGYLGQPVGSARLALPPLSTPDALGGSGAFSSAKDLDGWKLHNASGYVATKTLDAGAARITVSKSAGDSFGVNLYRESVPVKSGSRYTFTFRARAEKPTKIRARVTMSTAPWQDWVAFYDIELDDEWRTFELAGVSKGSDTTSRMMFDLGGETNTVWLDDVKVRAGSRVDVYRRDFVGGVALVNGSDTTMTVPLGGSYRKIRGKQVPSVNDGKVVESVSLPPRDGLVLLRQHLTLNGGATTTRDTTVPVTSNVPGATQMRFSTDGGVTWSTWSPYANETDVPLGAPLPNGSSGETRTVIAEYRDAEGNVTTATASITLLRTIRSFRLSGPDRYSTSLAVAAESHPTTAPAVVIASGLNYPDALCAAPLAAAYRGPVLLTPPTFLKTSVADKIASLRPSTVFIVGGTGAVSQKVQDALTKMPWKPKVIRIGGASRYDTAAKVAEQVRVKRGRVDRVVIANGKAYAGALLAAPMAAAKGWPILLVKPTDLPSGTSARVSSLRDYGLSSALVVGNTADVSDGVKSRLGIKSERVTGTDAYDLSRAMAAYSLGQGASTKHIAVATGLLYPDALSSGPLLARSDSGSNGSGFGILLFSAHDATRPDHVASPVASWLTTRRSDRAIEDVTAIGGPGAISDGNLANVLSLLQ